jgi:hypothetical protein
MKISVYKSVKMGYNLLSSIKMITHNIGGYNGQIKKNKRRSARARAATRAATRGD